MDHRLEWVYRQIPNSHCPPGCGRCCGPVYASRLEEDNIKRWLQRRGRAFHPFSRDYSGNTDCPYLTPVRTCAIYPVRPFLCRIMGVSDLVCPTGMCVPVKVLNYPQGNTLYKKMFMEGKEASRSRRHIEQLREIFRRKIC